MWHEANFKVKHVQALGYGEILDVQISFCKAGARDSAPCQNCVKHEGLWQFQPWQAWDTGRGSPKICKDEFRVEGEIQETCSSEMFGGLGADFLKGIAFWSIRPSALLR